MISGCIVKLVTEKASRHDRRVKNKEYGDVVESGLLLLILP